MSPDDLAVSDAAREALRRFVTLHGQPMPAGQYVGGGQPGECWTNAWTGEGQYVEGVVFDGMGRYGGTHAWNLGPLGTVVERTPGYEHVARYVGMVIDRANPAASTLSAVLGDGPRESVLETALSSIGPAATLGVLRGEITRVRAEPRRPSRKARRRKR